MSCSIWNISDKINMIAGGGFNFASRDRIVERYNGNVLFLNR